MPSCITFNLWMVNIRLDLLLALLQFQQTVRMSCPHEFTRLTHLKQDGIPSQPTLEYELRESMYACRSLWQHENPPTSSALSVQGMEGRRPSVPPYGQGLGPHNHQSIRFSRAFSLFRGLIFHRRPSQLRKEYVQLVAGCWRPVMFLKACSAHTMPGASNAISCRIMERKS